MSENPEAPQQEAVAAAPEVVAAPQTEHPAAAEPQSTGGGGGSYDRRGGGGAKPRRRFARRKICYFTAIKAEFVDYKDIDVLRRFVTERGKIIPRRLTGTSAKFQRLLTTAIKRARHLGLLPYVTS